MDAIARTANLTVTILCFGKLADLIAPEIDVDVREGSSVADLREALISRHPQAAEALRNARSRACIGNLLVADAHVLLAGEQVEFLPPVSGG